MANENGSCPDGWQMVKLSNLGEVNRGRSRHRPRYAEHLYGGPYPFIQTGDIKASAGRITTFEQTYSEAGLAQSRLWPAGTMCITIAANIAETGILAFPSCFPDSVVGFVADDSKCDVHFIEYVFRHLRRRIQHEATGSVQDNINLGTLERLRFPIPCLEEQSAIAGILGALDDKIELNRRMNETLEAMARAIFKSWFVDFDPVRAKLDGRHPPGMDADTAALFPDRFEHTTVGLVPRGWRFSRLKEMIQIKHGFAFKGEYFRKEPVGDILLTPGNFAIGGGFKGDKFKYYEGPVPDDYVLKSDDLLVTMTDLSKAGDTLGYSTFVPPSHGPRFLHNQRLGKIQVLPNQPVGVFFLYFTLCSPQYRHHVLATASGSTVKHTSPDRIRAFEAVLPDYDVGQRFEQTVSPIHKRIVAIRLESRTLAATRDAFLPKLLSGEIRVSDAEKVVGGVV